MLRPNAGRTKRESQYQNRATIKWLEPGTGMNDSSLRSLSVDRVFGTNAEFEWGRLVIPIGNVLSQIEMNGEV
jgi:hypothetical protein